MTEQRATTPTGVMVVAVAVGGDTLDVTEGVQALYDLVIQSMDWGSHFLSVEDVDPIVKIARFCGFKDFEAAERYVETERMQEKRRTCEHPRWREERREHDGHVERVCEECGLRRF